ncbi:PRA1 family protein F2 [Porphyridium purpureum]|uniref:PRA1 family protein n=1 Tax=Porphyridium purpureum TaxID=35688 RepID=A0A5J4Z4A1_PORPP|nr:PRA1 family protein F2 [Porphyridium purpureum]|eukprot:POR9187..scf295_1
MEAEEILAGQSGGWRGRVMYWAAEARREITDRDYRLPPRTWREFLERFTMPNVRDPHAVWNRVYLNLNYFQTNYIILYALSLIMFLLERPWSAIELTVLITGWVTATGTTPIIVRNRRVKRHERFLFMGVMSIVLPLCTGILFSLVKHFLVVTLLILLHAAVRHSSLRYRPMELHSQITDKW